MADTKCDDDYLPWLLAWDFNFLPDEEGMHEHDDLGGGEHMVLLASHNIQSNALFIYNQNW